MSNKSIHTAMTGVGSLCAAPSLGALLPDYIVDLLSEADAEAVDNHLQSCRDCKQRYLTVLQVRAEARRKRLDASGNGSGVLVQSEALGETDFDD
jgi:anti-sigma factor RsiW